MSIFTTRRSSTVAINMSEVVIAFNNIKQLELTSSTTDKVSLLRKFLAAHPFFKKVVVYALDSRLAFNVKKFPKELVQPSGTIDELFKHLDYLASRDGASNADKAKLFSLASHSKELFEIVKRICTKDLKCGVGVSLVNTAVQDTVFEIPYCRCSTDKKIGNIKYPAYVQEKADGLFCNCIISEMGEISFLTRDGKELLQLNKLREAIAKNLPSKYYGRVLQGELRIRENGKMLSRQVGNGIFTSCQYGTADQSRVDNAVLCIWNSVSINDFWVYQATSRLYKEAFAECEDIVNCFTLEHCVELIKTKIVYSYEEAWEFYLAIREEGGEGAILKNFTFLWKYHTSTNQIKLKNVSDADLIIIGWEYAKEDSKYDGYMGALICGTKCELLQVKVGTGFPDDLRKINWDDEIGSVVEILYESVSKSKTDKLHSLYLPRFNGFKRDRSRETADTLEDLLKR